MSHRRSVGVHLVAVAVCIGAGLLGGAEAVAAGPDWASLADAKEIFALTTKEGGEARETKIWLVVVDGQGYIRTTKSTKWGKDVVRDPDIAVRIENVEYPVHAAFVEDDGMRERVIGAFREKYGATDWWLQIFRGRTPHIMRLDPRAGG